MKILTVASMRSGSSWLHNVVKHVAVMKYPDAFFKKTHLLEPGTKRMIAGGAIVVSSTREPADAVIASFEAAPRFRGSPDKYRSNTFVKAIRQSIEDCKTVRADLRTTYEEITEDPVGVVRKVLELFDQDQEQAYGIAYRFRKGACPNWYTEGHIAKYGTDEEVFKDVA